MPGVRQAEGEVSHAPSMKILAPLLLHALAFSIDGKGAICAKVDNIALSMPFEVAAPRRDGFITIPAVVQYR